ncbi:MAG: glycosyltransferase family 2 protein [Anaerolineae bacterium]
MFESGETQTGKYDPCVVAIIPAYNEERYIGSVVLKTQEYTDEVIVVDDGSADRTASIAGLAGARVVRHGVNRGKGNALNTGFRAARSLHPQAIVILDGDGQHLPEEVPCVLAPILAGEADIVVGSRYLRNPCSVPRHRVWGHRAVNLLTDLGSGVSVSDSQSGFRAFSPRAVEAISFSSSGFSVESEMQFLAHDHRLRVVEVPITADYTDRPKRSVLNHGLKVLNGVLRLMGQYRPLLFFGVPGLAVLLVGLGWGVHAVDVLQRSQTLAAGYALLGVFLAVLGSLSLFTGITLHSVRGILQDLQGRGRVRHEASEPTAAQR